MRSFVLNGALCATYFFNGWNGQHLAAARKTESHLRLHSDTRNTCSLRDIFVNDRHSNDRTAIRQA